MTRVQFLRLRLAPAAFSVAVFLLWGGTVLQGELPASHRVDQSEACMQCHDLEDAVSARVPHPPVVNSECSACHNPHVARVEGLLHDQPAILCASCHSELVAQLQSAFVHRPVGQGRCLECHEPHGGDHTGLLKQPGRDLCIECHGELEDLGRLAVQHSPFRKNQCARCHDPHGAPNEGLLTATEGELCARCHPVSAAFTQKHREYPVERASCGTCHNPHAAAEQGLLEQNVHAPFDGGRCQTCHVSPTGSDPFALRVPEAELCGECHEEQVTESVSASFPHVSAGGGQCTACHNPHAGRGPALLKKSPNETCLECHDPGGASSDLPGRYTTHAEDLECTTCHQPHGAEQPLLLVSEQVELCSECHSHEHGVTHPLGEQARDPRSDMPMDCGSCHGIHDAPYDKYLHASGEGDVCIGCHRNKLGGGE